MKETTWFTTDINEVNGVMSLYGDKSNDGMGRHIEEVDDIVSGEKVM